MDKRSLLVALVFVIVLGQPSLGATAGQLDTARIEQLTGAKGKLDVQAGVFKVSVPRNDLSVTAAGVRLTPPMGLTSWAAFQRADAHTMVMGDLVLLEDQVNPVMSAALDNGLEVTALHNHFFWDSPKVMFMHIGGMGDEAKLAAAVGKVFAMIKETSGGKAKVPTANIEPAQTSLAPAKIEAILGQKGELSNGVYKVTMGRHLEGGQAHRCFQLQVVREPTGKRFDKVLVFETKAPPDGLIPLAILGFRHTLRPHVQSTIDEFRAAHVSLKVVSGDAPETVAAIAG